MRLTRPDRIETEPLELIETDDLEPAPFELTIDVDACGVCRTDLQIIEGDLAARRLPIVPGHQVVGRVRALGRGVEGWATGDRVGVGWMAGICGECDFCASDRENLCRYARFTGWDRDGGFATQINVRADFGFPLPRQLTDEQLAPLLCGGVIGYRSLRISGIEPGGRLGLFGFGASASLAIQVAVHWGCEVFVYTRSEAEQKRALDMGAIWAGAYDDPAPEPLDAAITFAPVGSVVVAALERLSPGGVVAINAIHLDEIPAFDYHKLWMERQIRSVANFTRSDALDFLSLASTIPIETAAMPIPLKEANSALAGVKHGSLPATAVLVP